jgi:hypothetical protein
MSGTRRPATDAWEVALVCQQGLTAAVSGFNVYRFAGYSSPLRRRRWGAIALVLVNLAFLVQSLYLGVLPPFLDEGLFLAPELRFAVGWMPLAASALIAAFIFRRARRR